MTTHTRCLARIHPPGAAEHWVRPHVCRLPHNHATDHECTCQYRWARRERCSA